MDGVKTFFADWLPLLLWGLFVLVFFAKGKGMFKNKSAIQEALKSNALVVDVRSPAEFSGGHVPGSLNIPVSDLPRRLGEIDRTRTIVLCCASGGRSAMAAAILKGNGFQQVHDAGPWQNALIQ